MPFTDPEAQRQYFRRYHADRKESRNEYRREWRRQHPLYSKDRYQADPAKFAAEKLQMTKNKQEAIAGRVKPGVCEIPNTDATHKSKTNRRYNVVYVSHSTR